MKITRPRRTFEFAFIYSACLLDADIPYYGRFVAALGPNPPGNFSLVEERLREESAMRSETVWGDGSADLPG